MGPMAHMFTGLIAWPMGLEFKPISSAKSLTIDKPFVVVQLDSTIVRKVTDMFDGSPGAGHTKKPIDNVIIFIDDVDSRHLDASIAESPAYRLKSF